MASRFGLVPTAGEIHAGPFFLRSYFMGAALEKTNVEGVVDSDADTALLRFRLDIVIPRSRYLELATLMDQEPLPREGAEVPPQPRRP
jgi:hypothetical protein